MDSICIIGLNNNILWIKAKFNQGRWSVNVGRGILYGKIIGRSIFDAHIDDEQIFERWITYLIGRYTPSNTSNNVGTTRWMSRSFYLLSGSTFGSKL